jgi:hypothetical protein
MLGGAAAAATPGGIAKHILTAPAAAAIPGAAGLAGLSPEIAAMVSVLLPHMETLNTDNVDDTEYEFGDDWKPGIDLSSYDGQHGYGSLPNGDEFHVRKTPNGNSYVIVYDMNDAGGDRHLVINDPKTNKPFDLQNYIGVPEDSGKGEFAFQFDREVNANNLPDEFYHYSNTDTDTTVEEADVADTDRMVDNIVNAGGIKQYLDGIYGGQTAHTAANVQGTNDLDTIKKHAGVDVGNSIARGSVMKTMRDLINKVHTPEPTVKHMGQAQQQEPLALPAPDDSNTLPQDLGQKQHEPVPGRHKQHHNK